jgi:hypothetical protein
MSAGWKPAVNNPLIAAPGILGICNRADDAMGRIWDEITRFVPVCVHSVAPDRRCWRRLIAMMRRASCVNRVVPDAVSCGHLLST